jgi:hypothetical protein
MELRAYPRTRLSLPVGLYCPDKNSYYRRKISNISMGGMFISGTSCGRNGMGLDVIVNPNNKSPEEPERYTARIIRNSTEGFALSFNNLGKLEREMLQDIIWPRWDGKDDFEGMLIVAARENVVGLSGWLRLTSLVCNEYKRVCNRPH